MEKAYFTLNQMKYKVMSQD